jgi:hypothetical protein
MASICPLTPSLLAHWLGGNAATKHWNPAIYISLIGKLNPAVPVWPHGQLPYVAGDQFNPITAALENILLQRKGEFTMPLSQAYKQLCAQFGPDKPSVREFLASLKRSRIILVDFSADGQATVVRRHISIRDAAKAILLASDRALTAEEIMAKARPYFRGRTSPLNLRSFRNTLYDRNDFTRIGPHSYVLRNGATQ